MKSIVDEHEQEFSILCAEITTQSGKLKLATNGKDTEELVAKLKALFTDAEETLEQIELESHNMETGAREKISSRIITYRKELKRFKALYESCRQEASERSARLELFSNSQDNAFDSTEKDLLLENGDILEQSDRNLHSGRKLLRETEEIGAGVLADLEQQRETIQRSRGRLKDMDAGLGQGSAILTTMMFRARQNKIVLLAVSLVILFVVIFGIYRLVTH